MHLRELESSMETIASMRLIEETDFDAEIQKLADQPPEEARRERAELRANRGLQRCLRGDPEGGLAEWAEVIAEVPELAYPYLLRARWLLRTDAQRALEDYDRAAAVEPRNALVYWRRGACHKEMGDQDRALANYRRALSLDPTAIDVLADMGKLFAERGEHAEAVAAYDRAIAQAPRYADFYLGRALSLMEVGGHEAALRDYDRILELDPSRNDVRFYRAMCHAYSGHSDRAIEEMAALVEREPEDHHNHRMLGKLRLEQGQVDRALEDLSRAVALGPDHAAGYVHRARALLAKGDKEGALSDYDRAIALAPGDAEIYVARARTYASLDRVPEALEDAERVIARAPLHAFGYAMRAAYRKYLDGELALVDADFDRAVELAPNDVSVRFHRGDHLREEGRYAAALVDYERVIAVAPRLAAAYYGRGYCRARLDEEQWEADPEWDEDEEVAAARYRAAIEDFERAIALGLQDEEVYAELWSAHGALRDRDAALAALDRGIEAVPTSAMLHYHRIYMRRSRGDLEGAEADRARAEELGFRFNDD